MTLTDIGYCRSCLSFFAHPCMAWVNSHAMVLPSWIIIMDDTTDFPCALSFAAAAALNPLAIINQTTLDETPPKIQLNEGDSGGCGTGFALFRSKL